MSSHPNDDDLPPPTYEEAIKESTSAVVEQPAPAQPPRRRAPPPDLPVRPNQNQPRASSSNSTLSHSSNNTNTSNRNSSSSISANLYTNNPDLPFNYVRGYYCKKCKNSGYKRPHEICRDCWDRFYLSKNAYNPNKRNIPFKYPKGFYCSKCGNTGYKFKNSKTCQNCWSQFGPRNNYQHVNQTFSPSFFGSMTYASPMGPPAPNARRVAPGSPELGGLLCGNCRGEGMVHFLFDTDLCPVCGGLGRVFTNPPPQPHMYPPPVPGPRPPPPPQPYHPPQQQYNYGGKR
ncbi:hypothetical protein G210_3200 [Candida maltosa Xu316]|uniref:Proline-rich protein HUA1 n=1 Tax=Candida maltosa (strain Xu316) TaxID=1245528 RepID=M3J3T6_CANMX|nr:hypothetical protein G210_3200 [Candida maltosa Xu316]